MSLCALHHGCVHLAHFLALVCPLLCRRHFLLWMICSVLHGSIEWSLRQCHILQGLLRASIRAYSEDWHIRLASSSRLPFTELLGGAGQFLLAMWQKWSPANFGCPCFGAPSWSMPHSAVSLCPLCCGACACSGPGQVLAIPCCAAIVVMPHPLELNG
jgi:hypothetical protein